MFGTKRFGRNISNVQREYNPGKPVMKKDVDSSSNLFNVSQTNLTVHKRKPVKKAVLPQDKSKSYFGVFNESNPIPSVDSFLDEPDVEPMCIDSDINLEPEHEDIDRFDTNDPQFVAEYINDIMEFLKEKESAVRISDNYCDKQKDIKPRQRNQLIRWMAEVYVQLKLLSETFFLSANIVDQILDNCLVSRKKLHLIGVTALFIASKYEETWAPPLNDFRICCDYAFTQQDILRMEREILNRINFNLCIPAPIHFLRRYSKAGHSDGLTHTIAKFLAEMTCQYYTMLKFLPSEIAGACVLLARQIRGGYAELWDDTLRYYSGYDIDNLRECGTTLTALLHKEFSPDRQTCGIVRKYSEKKLLGVSVMVRNALRN